MKNPTVLVNLHKCTGCRGCQIACKSWHQLRAVDTCFFQDAPLQNPPFEANDTYMLVKFREVVVGKKVRWFFRKHQCMQCRKAPCIKACGLGAIIKEPGGHNRIDVEKCDGCGLCVDVCPYDVIIKFHSEKQGIKCDKCDFCYQRLAIGLASACASSCPAGALSFGERAEQLEQAEQAIKQFPLLKLYGEREMGGLGFLYLYEQHLAWYDLVERPKPMTPFIQMLRGS